MWFANAARAAGLALALLTPIALAGCTLTPVYGDAVGTNAALALTYAEPDNRLEQIVYQQLSLRLGEGGPDAPVFSATVAISVTSIGLSDVPSPITNQQVVATIDYSVTRDDAIIASGARSASAGYQTTGQLVADQAAGAGAQEQATRAAADTVRLALIAALAPQ